MTLPAHLFLWMAVRRALRHATVEVTITPQLAPASRSTPWTVLVVGTDRRPSDDALAGARADAICLAVGDPARAELTILRIPRDLGAELPGVGRQKLGWALDYGGATMLAAAVADLTGCPIHHYLEVKFEGFTELVDLIGGVEVVVAARTVDDLAELRLDAGTQRLDGRTALALARSRHDDRTPLGDLVRIHRQNAILIGLLRMLRLRPMTSLHRFDRIARHVVVDDRLDAGNLVRFCRDAARFEVTTHVLPVVPARPSDELVSAFPPHQKNSSEIYVLRRPEAALLLARICTIARGGEPRE